MMNLSFPQMVELEKKSLFGFYLPNDKIKEFLSNLKLEMFEDKYVVARASQYRIEQIDIWGKKMQNLRLLNAEILGYYSLSDNNSCSREFHRISIPLSVPNLNYLLSYSNYKDLRSYMIGEIELCGIFKTTFSKDKSKISVHLLRGDDMKRTYFSPHPVMG